MRAASPDRPPAAHRSAARPPRARLGGVLAAVLLALALSACGGEGATDGDGAPDGDAARWDGARWDEATWR